MKKILSEIFVRFYGPLHSLFMRLWAYGPWGPLHQFSIRIFAALFGIEIPRDRKFQTLGDFFLRDMPLRKGQSILQSPAEAELVDGPSPLSAEEFGVKGLSYCWTDFSELNLTSLKNSARFWNLYLAPHNYHWVHAPCDGPTLQVHKRKGRKWPVNKLGRFLCPRLYIENDRVSFSWDHPVMGRIVVICVGAMGVSSLRTVKSENSPVIQGEKLLAFELGSTVLLIVENPPPLRLKERMLRVGDDL